MARPRRSASVRRIELRLRADDPVLEEVAREAERRGVELQQHIYDLLRGRYLLRRGESLATLLWLPGERPPVNQADRMNEPEPARAADLSASAAAAAWSTLLGTSDSEAHRRWHRPARAALHGRCSWAGYQTGGRCQRRYLHS
jgi:hypothetical protein